MPEIKHIRVLIADDHPAFREGLLRLLSDEKDLKMIGTAGDGEEAVRLVNELKPDVAIIDVAMPKLNGVEVTRQVRESPSKTHILILSAHNIEPYMAACLRAGASGYLLKTTPINELAGAIRLVNAGRMVFDMQPGSRVLGLNTPRGKTGLPQEALHARELEILRLVARGMGNREIAAQLVVSERTIHTHLVNVFRKLSVKSRTEAVLTALKEGWLALEDLP